MQRVWIGVTSGTAAATLGALLLMFCAKGVPEKDPGPVLSLPEAPVRFGETEAAWSIALFVDFESAASRQAFSQVTGAITGGNFVAGRGRLQLLHAPGGGCAEDSRNSFRCAAARAVECAEDMSPGAGIAAAGTAFDLQWEPGARTVDELVRRAAREPGIDSALLSRCVAEDQAVAARVEAHIRFAAERGLAAAPGGFLARTGAPQQIAPFDAWVTADTLYTLSVCLARGRCKEAS